MKRLVAAAAVLLLLGAGLWWWASMGDHLPVAAPAAALPTAGEVKHLESAAPPPKGSGQVSGRVVDDAGGPLEGVLIEVKLAAAPVIPADCAALLEGCSCGDRLEQALIRLDEAFANLGETKTGADGRFTVTGLPSLPMRVRATDLSRFATADARAGDDALRLTLSEPMSDGVVVVDEQDRPIKGAAVIAIAGGKILDYERTDESGVLFLLVPPETKLRVFASGLAPGAPDLSSSYFLGQEDGGELTATGRQVRLERGTTVRGRLESFDGGALGGAEIRASSDRWRGEELICATAITEPDGTYVLGPLPGDRFELEAQAGKKHLKFSYPPLGRRGPTDGATVTQLLEDATVRGKVVDEQGLAIPEATATMLRFPFGGGAGDTFELVLDSQGRFEQTVTAGSVTLEAKAKGYLSANAEKRVEENEVWEPALVLVRASALRGRVEAANGQPVKGAQIYARPPNPPTGGKLPGPRFPPTTQTDELGNFTLETFPGELDVEVSARAYLPGKVHAHAPQDGLKIVLVRGATVKGRVLNEDQSPAPRISVSLEGTAGQGSVGSCQTAPDGTFTAEGIPAGAYTIKAVDYARPSLDPAPSPIVRTARLARTAQKSIEVSDTAGPFVELILDGIKPARGKVVDERGAPLAGVTVVLESLNTGFSSAAPTLEMQLQLSQVLHRPMMLGGFSPQAVTDGAGAFSFEGLDRRYRATAEWQGLHEDPTALVEVGPGSDSVLTLQPKHFLTADFVSSDGQPVNSVFIGWRSQPTPGGHLAYEVRVQGSGPLSIASPGHVTVIRNVTLSPRADLALGQIRLETGRLLTVQVTDAVSGAPLNAQAWWRANGAIALREDRADGTAVTLPAGEVNLEVGAMDHLSQTVKVAAAQSTLAVQLDPGSVVTGRVTRADGRPLAGRWYVFVACGANEASGLADANGLATLKGVAPGNCTATAGAPNGAQRGPAKPLVVPAHGTASVDVVAPGP